MVSKVAGLLNPVSLFVVIALIFGAYFVKTVPPLWGVDEYTHFDRAFQIAYGTLTEHYVSVEGYGAKLPDNLIELSQRIHLDLADNKPGDILHRHDVDDLGQYRRITRQRPSTHWREFPNGGAAYSPVAYAPAIVGILVSRVRPMSLGHVIMLSRLCTLLFYILAAGFAIWAVGPGRVRWLLLTVALLPMSLFQASIVNADAMANALAFVVFALAVALVNHRRARWWHWTLLIIAAAALPLVKPIFAVVSMLAVFLVFFRTKHTLWQRFALAACTTVLIVAPAMGWYSIAKTTTTATSGLVPAVVGHIDARAQLHSLLLEPQIFVLRTMPLTLLRNGDAYFISAVGSLGWNFIALPTVFVAVLWGLMMFAALYSRPALPRGWSAALLGVAVLTALTTFIALYLTFSGVKGDNVYGVQGRYFIPVLPMLLVGLARFIPIRIEMSARTTVLIFSAVPALSLAVAALYYTLATY